MDKKEVGVKNDGDKPDLSLVPTEAIFEMAKALTFGAKKYSRYNFRNGMDISRPLAASLRHIYQFLDGQDIDEETQCIHLGNAMAGLAMALWIYKNKPEFDNRYKKPKEQKEEGIFHCRKCNEEVYISEKEFGNLSEIKSVLCSDCLNK